MNRLSVAFARTLLHLWPARPPDPAAPRGLQEIFEHPRFTAGSDDQRAAIMDASSRWKYADERDHPWDRYFGRDLAPLLRGKRVLDLGCFTGGRSVIWAERYGLKEIHGVDVDECYVEAARRFAESRGIAGEFRVSAGESLPHSDGSFDALLSFDVFEHVRDVPRTLAECRRVVRPGGLLFLVFPGYFQPNEHHLGFVTRAPGVQWLVGGPSLVAAYTAILQERGPAHAWYARARPELESWERGHTINGTTCRGFRRLLAATDLEVVHDSRLPLFRVGRFAERYRAFRLLGHALTPLARAPLLEEALRHRITYILRRPAS